MVSRIVRLWRAVAVFDGPWPRTDSAAAWLIAIALILAGFFSKPLIEAAIGGQLPPYITMYAAVTISALLGGPRIGLATALVTVLLTWYFFLPPHGSFAITSARTAVVLILYLVLSGFQAWIIGKARLALEAMTENEARRDRAARESVHRIKNLIAVVQAIASKIAREVQTTGEYKTVLSNRLVALGSAQDVLVRSGWSDVELAHIIKASLAPFLPNPGLEVRYGPKVLVPARHVSGLNMALYELCTNSLKYGALAEGRGPVVLMWRCDERSVVLEWVEQTPAPATRQEGLGTQLIRYALGNDTDCGVDYIVDGTRVHAVFRWPARAAVSSHI
jgi:two-component sensor histidine kinase